MRCVIGGVSWLRPGDARAIHPGVHRAPQHSEHDALYRLDAATVQGIFSRLKGLKGTQYAFGETHQNGRRNIESFATQHHSVINFMPVKGRVYFVRYPTAATNIA